MSKTEPEQTGAAQRGTERDQDLRVTLVNRCPLGFAWPILSPLESSQAFPTPITNCVHDQREKSHRGLYSSLGETHAYSLTSFSPRIFRQPAVQQANAVIVAKP